MIMLMKLTLLCFNTPVPPPLAVFKSYLIIYLFSEFSKVYLIQSKLPFFYSHFQHFFIQLPLAVVPTGSLSSGGDAAVNFFDINQPSLITPFYSVLVSVSVFMALSAVFHFINSPDKLSALSFCSSGLISAVLVLSTIYLCVKVSLSRDKSNPLWLTGLKAPTN